MKIVGKAITKILKQSLKVQYVPNNTLLFTFAFTAIILKRKFRPIFQNTSSIFGFSF